MVKCLVFGGSFVVACLLWQAGAQTGPARNREPGAFGLTLPVDEVVITFHAADAHGLPVNDLKESEIGLLDNANPPARILRFGTLSERPLRAGILIDTSESMFNDFPRIRAVATEYARHLFRQQSDKAFVMDFAYSSEFAQSWTSDRSILSRSAADIKAGKMNPRGGTALFNALFKACQYGFDGIDPSASGNFIMLFTDGEDNAGRTTLEEALNACQRSNVAIYAFRSRPSEGSDAEGSAVMTKLARESGGRLFDADANLEAVFDDLKVIESDLRSEYQLIYRPSNFKRDGTFHNIVMKTPNRVATIQVRTGYFAPAN